MQGFTSPTQTPRLTNDAKSVRSYAPVTPLRPSPTPQQPKYSHPYGIQSTSSGVLSSSRGTASPNTVISTHSYQQHKSNQTMRSLLRNSNSVNDLAQSASGNLELTSASNKENIERTSFLGGKYDSVRTRKRTLAQRASMSDLSTVVRDSPGEWEADISASPRKHVAEMRAAFLKGDETDGGNQVGCPRNRRPELGEWQRGLDNLSHDPTDWSTAELATFVCLALTHDTLYNKVTTWSSTIPGESSTTAAHANSKTGQYIPRSLPLAVVDDIRTWIFRRQLTGKAFIRDGEGDWCTSENPPPFLPILLWLSQNLFHIFPEEASNLSGDKDGVPHRPLSSAHDSHVRSADVLKEADESEEVEGINFALPDDMDDISHVRRVIDRFDGRIFDDIRSPSNYRHNDDLFSQGEIGRYKPRTTSFSSLNSIISDVSADPSESRIVSQRMAQFEKGNVGRVGPRNVREREGRVLEDQPSNDHLAPHLLISPSHQETEVDVFGDTIKPKKRNHTTVPVSGLALLANAGSDHVAPPMSPLLSTPAHVADMHLSKSTSSHDPSALLQTLHPRENKLTPEKQTETREGMLDDSELSARDTSKFAGQFADLLRVSPEAGHKAQQQQRDNDATYNAVSDATQEPQHMACMAEHEKAGLTPYGALRGAYTSPPPSATNPIRLTAQAGLARPSVQGLQSSSMLNELLFHENLRGEFQPTTSQSPLRALPKSNAVHVDMLSLFSLKPPTDLHAVNLPRYPSADPRSDDSVLLQTTTSRLALAEARIQDLERALEEIVEKQKTPSRRIWSSDYPDYPDPARAGFGELGASSEDQTPANSGDKINLTITKLLAWLLGGSTTSSLPSSAVPFAVPQTLRQIPGYVFLVGVGLSVIVGRTILLSPYSRGK